ncbi:MAG TPA: ATP-binding protein [Chitinophagaceae bacterium]|nr:ATP-binding protein [Chitinophagaceae bacterium]
MLKETTPLLIYIFLMLFAVFMLGIFLILRQTKRNRLLHIREKELIKREHQEQLLEARLKSQQQTMQHIGQEIHDNVGQKLTLASLYTRQIQDPDQRIHDIASILDQSLIELRQLSKSLTNPGLAHADLIQLLNEEAQRINGSGLCQVQVIQSGDSTDLQAADKNIIFRLLQEFIQNSLKHAKCRHILIRLVSIPGQLCITATDDGKGFDTLASTEGIGLQNIRRRAAQLKAVYNMESTPEKGTVLTLEIPLNEV